MRQERKKPEVTDSAADVEVSVSKGDQGILAGYKIKCKKFHIICHICSESYHMSEFGHFNYIFA